MKSKDDVIEVWQKKWGLRSDVEREIEGGAVYITVARLEQDLTSLYKKGIEAGKNLGRMELIESIENGTCDPIKPRETS